VGVSDFFRRKRRVYPFFQTGEQNIDIEGNIGPLVAQKVLKYSKIAQISLLGSFGTFLSYLKKQFAILSFFCRF
jgi:hypothetical protein